MNIEIKYEKKDSKYSTDMYLILHFFLTFFVIGFLSAFSIIPSWTFWGYIGLIFLITIIAPIHIKFGDKK